MAAEHGAAASMAAGDPRTQGQEEDLPSVPTSPSRVADLLGDATAPATAGGTGAEARVESPPPLDPSATRYQLIDRMNELDQKIEQSGSIAMSAVQQSSTFAEHVDTVIIKCKWLTPAATDP